MVPPSRSWRETCTSVGPARFGAPSSAYRDSAVRKRHDEVSLKVTVECAAVARATWRQVSRLVAGTPQFTTMRWLRADSSNDRHPACASLLIESGGGEPASTSSRESPHWAR